MNKIVLITGGSRGLGKSMALHCAAKGNNVIITYVNNKEMADAVVAEIQLSGKKAAALRFDAGDINSIGNFVEELQSILKESFGADKLDYLVNNAGMGATIPFLQSTEADFDRFMDVHFKSIYFLTQKIAGIMNSGGGIVNISSGTTRFSNPGYSLYASMKGGIEVFTKYLAKELGAQGIRANVVAPGPVETDFNNAAIRNNPEMKARLSMLSPLGRVGEADDIGPVVAFLCSDESVWVNGQRIEVSGGINS